MTSAYAMDVFGLSASLLAAVAFLWALLRRQLRTEDRAMYEAVCDVETDLSAPPDSTESLPLLTRWLFSLALLGVIAVMVWPVIAMFNAANHVPQRPPVARSRPHVKE